MSMQAVVAEMFDIKCEKSLRFSVDAAVSEVVSRRITDMPVAELDAFIAAVSAAKVDRGTRQRPSPLRVYLDGAFDMTHFGHANAMRQARALGDVLIVGVCADADIKREKGSAPILDDAERLSAVQSIKWVDEVIMGVPYIPSAEFVRFIVHEHKIDIIVHGDDPCFDAEGNDVYAEARAMGLFRNISRTEGVSTTDIIGRMLLCTTDHFSLDDTPSRPDDLRRRSSGAGHGEESDIFQRATRVTKFLPSTRRFNQFAVNALTGHFKAPAAGDRVVYVCGAFDMFHAGHIALLARARQMGDHLIVGVHNDWDVNRVRGGNFPIMNLHERALGVCSSRYVDEVIVGVPFDVTAELLDTFNVTCVVSGSVSDSAGATKGDEAVHAAYDVPRERGILQQVPSDLELTTGDLVARIVLRRNEMETKFAVKSTAEAKFYSAKYKK